MRHTFVLQGRNGRFQATVGILGSWRIVSIVDARGVQRVASPQVVFSGRMQGGPITVTVQALPGAATGRMVVTLSAPNGRLLPGTGSYVLQP